MFDFIMTVDWRRNGFTSLFFTQRVCSGHTSVYLRLQPEIIN